MREALTSERLDAMAPREAAALFVARRAEGLTAGEAELLAAWLAADAGHRGALQQADRAWAAFDDAEGDDILAAMRRHARAPRRRPAWPGWTPAAVAAGLLVAVGAGLLVVPGLRPPTPGGREVAAGAPALQYASARGEVKDIVLADGSTMTLDADSAVAARFQSKRRDIQLVRGRAFFSVAPDRARPFAVTAGGQRVTAVGTRFDVALTADGMSATLVQGHVTVGPAAAAAPSLTLEPGQQFVERLGQASVRTLGPRAQDATAWRTGVLDFDGESLAAAAATMNRYARQDRIVVRDPRIAGLRLSGQFRAGEAERFARTIAEIYRLRVVRHGDELELVPAA